MKDRHKCVLHVLLLHVSNLDVPLIGKHPLYHTIRKAGITSLAISAPISSQVQRRKGQALFEVDFSERTGEILDLIMAGAQWAIIALLPPNI